MSKTLCIPDIHLKTWIFDAANAIIESRNDIDHVIVLGDLVDEWGHQNNRTSYDALFDTVDDFIMKHPDTLWCWGNHDFAYRNFGYNISCSGRSENLLIDIYEKFKSLEQSLGDRLRIAHIIDDVIFSHAGFGERWTNHMLFNIRRKHAIDNIIPADSAIHDIVNDTNEIESPKTLWNDDSPLWLRPDDYILQYTPDVYQVIGHTPVKKPTLQEGHVLICDTFSIYRDGRPIGNQCFVLYDTETHTWTEIPASHEAVIEDMPTLIPLPDDERGYTVPELADIFQTREDVIISIITEMCNNPSCSIDDRNHIPPFHFLTMLAIFLKHHPRHVDYTIEDVYDLWDRACLI